MSAPASSQRLNEACPLYSVKYNALKMRFSLYFREYLTRIELPNWRLKIAIKVTIREVGYAVLTAQFFAVAESYFWQPV